MRRVDLVDKTPAWRLRTIELSSLSSESIGPLIGDQQVGLNNIGMNWLSIRPTMNSWDKIGNRGVVSER